jgi:hypothetical protein
MVFMKFFALREEKEGVFLGSSNKKKGGERPETGHLVLIAGRGSKGLWPIMWLAKGMKSRLPGNTYLKIVG